MSAAPFKDMDNYLEYLRALPDIRLTDDEALELKCCNKTTELFETVAPMVTFIAQKYVYDAHQRENYQDLIQEGNLAILLAIDSWQAGKGMAFSSWCYMYIRKAIVREMQRDIKFDNQHVNIDFDFTYDAEVAAGSRSTGYDHDDLEDIVSDDGEWQRAQDEKARYRAIHAALPERDQILLDNLLQGHTQERIARCLGVSQSRVSRLTGDLYDRIKADLQA